MHNGLSDAEQTRGGNKAVVTALCLLALEIPAALLSTFNSTTTVTLQSSKAPGYSCNMCIKKGILKKNPMWNIWTISIISLAMSLAVVHYHWVFQKGLVTVPGFDI